MNPDRQSELRWLMEHEARMSQPASVLFRDPDSVEKTCKRCGKKFWASRRFAGTKVYCTSECTYLAGYKYEPKGTVSGTCKVCGKPFKGSRTKRFCTARCKVIHGRRTRNARAA